MVQTTVTSAPAKAKAGLLVDGNELPDIISCVVDEEAGIAPGRVVLRGTGGDNAAILPSIEAADPNGIVEATATSGSGAVEVLAAAATGDRGAGPFIPAVKLTVTLNSHANWDQTTGTIVYEDENGILQTESLAIPDGGNTVLTTTGFARRFVSVSVPQQSGTAGSFEVGTSSTPKLGGDVLGLALLTHKALLAPSSDNNEVHEFEAVFPVLRRGRVWVVVENAFEAGDRVFVRGIAGVGEARGALRVSTTDSGDAIELPGARLMSSGSAGEFGILEVSL